MKPIKAYLIFTLLMPCILFTNSCSGADGTHNTTPETVLVGSTPGDDIIKSILSIPPATKIDFIRWDLTLSNNTFVLNVNFGESQPNTLGFKEGGEKRLYEGTYTVFKRRNNTLNGEIYHLKSNNLSGDILIVKLNDNLFHLLTPQNKLMIGNGGWSYTLNRKQPITEGSISLPNLAMSSPLLNDTALQITFDGRTPCDIAKENNFAVTPGCFKLKWRIIFNRDPKTFLPTTYKLQRTNNRESVLEGKWTIIKGVPSNPDAVILQLDPDKPEKSLSLLVGDENVLFFLNKQNQLYVGNHDFSFTLNKK